jgi:hypothetical protein
MISHTEAEAKKKWCPFARVTCDGEGPYNRDADGGPAHASKCIASSCMAWNRCSDGSKSNSGYCGFAVRSNIT